MNSGKQRKYLVTNLFLAAFIFSAVLMIFETTGAFGQSYKIYEGYTLFDSVYKHVLNHYIEEKSPLDLSKSAIDGIFDSLDPYSSFLDKRDFKQLQEDTKGEFGGLGIEISTLNNYPRIMSYPIEGKPAMTVGLRAGDEIVEIDGKSTFKMPINEVVGMLRGKPGDPVDIKIQRVGSEDLLEFHIVRAIIPVLNIPYHGVIDEGIGYIKLSRFTQTAKEEMENALDDLVDQNVKSVILDLRYNPGGLLIAARDVANKFLPKNSLLVFTRDRNGNKDMLYASEAPKLPTIPLIVLVNKGSASGSEIVAGAIQDHDRGVLIGETTFGKGSVQTVYNDLPDQNGLKLTTAHYYTPSGRCIHKERTLDQIYDAEMSLESDEAVEDTLAKKDRYFTDNERIVYGGGGITPDIIIKEETLGNIVTQLLSRSVFLDFAVVYTEQHPELEVDFEVTDDLLGEFKTFIGSDSVFTYTIPGKTYLDSFKKLVEKEGYNSDILVTIEKLEQALINKRDDDFEANRETIKRILKREISVAKFGSSQRTIASKAWDIQLKKAIEILNDTGQYQSLLAKGAETGIEMTQGKDIR